MWRNRQWIGHRSEGTAEEGEWKLLRQALRGRGGGGDQISVRRGGAAAGEATNNTVTITQIPAGAMGRRFQHFQTSRIETMSAWALDEALANVSRRAAADAATVGVMRLSSRGGNSGAKDAMASSDN